VPAARAEGVVRLKGSAGSVETQAVSDPVAPPPTFATNEPDPGAAGPHARRYAASAVVFDEGEAGDALYVIRSGEIEIARQDGEGMRHLQRLGPGEFFGEQSALFGGPRRSRATASADTELLVLDAGLVEEMCLDRPDIGLRFTRALAARAGALEQRIVTPPERDGVRTMVRVLLARAHAVGDTTRVDGTLRVLAREAGLTLPEAHRALLSLIEGMVLTLVDDVLHVPRLEALVVAADTLS
jgi:CRP-like cAMP-binding protein